MPTKGCEGDRRGRIRRELTSVAISHESERARIYAGKNVRRWKGQKDVAEAM